jgi:hypothetical protein
MTTIVNESKEDFIRVWRFCQDASLRTNRKEAPPPGFEGVDVFSDSFVASISTIIRASYYYIFSRPSISRYKIDNRIGSSRMSLLGIRGRALAANLSPRASPFTNR